MSFSLKLIDYLYNIYIPSILLPKCTNSEKYQIQELLLNKGNMLKLLSTLIYSLLVFNATFNNISVYIVAVSFLCWMNQEYPEKTTDL
jgi:hypothetical protein